MKIQELVVGSCEQDRFNCNFEFWQIAYYLSEIDLTKLMQNEMSKSKGESNIGAIFHMNNMQWCRKVKTLGVPVVIGGDNLPSPVGIGLTDLPNILGRHWPPWPPGSGITDMVVVWRQDIFDRSNEHTFISKTSSKKFFMIRCMCHSMARANLNKFGEFIIMKYYHSIKEVQNLHQLKSTFHIPS